MNNGISDARVDDEADAVFGLTEQFVSPELDPEEVAGLRVDTRPQLSYSLATMLVRRRVMEDVGRFDTGLTSGSNIDWLSRARFAGMRERSVAEVVHRRRIHTSNMGRTVPEANANLVRIARAHLERQRAGER